MKPLEEDLIRNIIRALIETAQNSSVALNDQTRQLLGGISPLEIEQVVNLCSSHVRLDVDAMVRDVRRIKSQSMVTELITAGASNQLLRDLFGIRYRDIVLLRTELGINTPKRRVLTDQEERSILDRYRGYPIAESEAGDTKFMAAVWSLAASRELDLPLMPIYRTVLKLDSRRRKSK